MTPCILNLVREHTTLNLVVLEYTLNLVVYRKLAVYTAVPRVHGRTYYSCRVARGHKEQVAMRNNF